jgi:hypothetical protein
LTIAADHAPPSVLLSGAAYDQRGDGLTGDNYPLHVAATDNTGTDPRSGVARIQILVDGTQRYHSGTQSCPAGACSLAADFTVTIAQLLDGPDGSHDITVVATDLAGNAQTVPFTMFFNYGGRPDPYSTEADDPLSPDELNGVPYPGDPCAVDLPECRNPEDPEDPAGFAAAASTSLYYGLADQNGGYQTYPFANVLSSTEFLGLRVRRLRMTVPWDMMNRPNDATDMTNQDSGANFQNFYDAVTAYNASHTTQLLVLVSFDRHRGGSNEPGAMPGYTAYKTSITKFMDAYPAIHEFSAFNEPNDKGHQLYNNPGIAAQLYRGLAEVCATKSCTHVLGGEFVDNDSYSQSYLESYINYLVDHRVRLPNVWAWHAYKAFTTGGVTKFRGSAARSAGPASAPSSSSPTAATTTTSTAANSGNAVSPQRVSEMVGRRPLAACRHAATVHGGRTSSTRSARCRSRCRAVECRAGRGGAPRSPAASERGPRWASGSARSSRLTRRARRRYRSHPGSGVGAVWGVRRGRVPHRSKRLSRTRPERCRPPCRGHRTPWLPRTRRSGRRSGDRSYRRRRFRSASLRRRDEGAWHTRTRRTGQGA